MQRITINSASLKIEKVNAKAMIEGFIKEGKRHFVSLYTAGRNSKSLERNFAEFPKLITLQKQNPRKDYPMSSTGERLNAASYRLPYQYIAILDTIYEIVNDKILWKAVCINGLFDIWNPDAPFNSYFDPKTREKKEKPMILLIRFAQIGKDFSLLLDHSYTYYDRIPDGIDREVNLVRPILCNNDFDAYRAKLESSLRGYLRNKEDIFDSNQWFRDFRPAL